MLSSEIAAIAFAKIRARIWHDKKEKAFEQASDVQRECHRKTKALATFLGAYGRQRTRTAGAAGGLAETIATMP